MKFVICFALLIASVASAPAPESDVEVLKNTYEQGENSYKFG